MSRKVYVHIGAPKTGTTYLQDRLGRNARSLAAHGVHFPARSRFGQPSTFHFRAALDLLDQDWGGPPGHAEGAWEAMVRRVRRLDGTVVISHEILAPALPEQIARLKRDLADSELHVVYSARDLARQAPAGWQESVKQGRRWSYRRYLNRLVQGRAWFARAFDLPQVLTSWGDGLPPSQVHVVTVPQAEISDADPDLLWRRCCQAFGIDPAWAPTDSDSANASLGSAETQVLRQLNKRLGRGARRGPEYDRLVLDLLATKTLGKGSQPILLPPELHGWAEAEGRRFVEWIEQSGVDVVGDPVELLPVPSPAGQEFRHPDRVSQKAQFRAALDALAAMTKEAADSTSPADTVRATWKRLRGTTAT
jgi:hypothetical protein